MKRFLVPLLALVLLFSGCKAIYDPADYDYTVGANVERELAEMAALAGTDELVSVLATESSIQARFRLADEVVFMKPGLEPTNTRPADRSEIGIPYGNANLGQLIDQLEASHDCPAVQYEYEHMAYDVGVINQWCGQDLHSYWANDMEPIQIGTPTPDEMRDVYNRLIAGGPTRGRTVGFSNYLPAMVELVDAELNVMRIQVLTSGRVMATDDGHDPQKPFWLDVIDIDSMHSCATKLAAQYNSETWSIDAHEGNNGLYYITIVQGQVPAIHTDTNCVPIPK